LKRLRVIAVCVGLVLACPASAQDAGRAELMQLYLASIVADRCEFPLTELEADAIQRAAIAIQKKLKLSDQAADDLFSEVEAGFEKKLPDACKKDGDLAKGYQQVLERLRK
jgi:hypothetical protein